MPMKFFLVIKLFLLFSLGAIGQERLQEKRITLTAANKLLSEVLADLGEKEGLSFTYGSTINLSQRVTVNLNSVSLTEALDKILKPCNIEWEIIDKQVVLMPGNKPRFTISGSVRDSVAGDPLPYAAVKIKDASFSTLTDFEGKFTLRNVPEGSHILLISNFGYRAYASPIQVTGKSTKFSIPLSPEAITLSETIVTSDKIIERASVSQMELNQAQLQMNKGISNDPLNSLTALPGVLGRIDIYGTSNIHIRGGESFENQFLLDNIKLSFPFYSIGQSVFNPDMLEKAEVLTGGYASNYGQSMSSVFNLTTKTGDFQTFKGNVDFSVLNNSALLQGPLIKNKFSFIVGVRKNNLDLLNLNQHSKAFFMGDVSSKLTYIVNEKTKVSVTSINVVDNLDFTHSPDFRLKLRAKNTINAQNLQVQTVMGKKTYSKTSFLHSGLTTSSKFGKYYYNTNNTTYGLREDLTHYLNSQSKIKTGIELNLEDDKLSVFDYYRATDIAITDTAHLLLNIRLNTTNVTSAAYAFYDATILKRILLNVGARLDYSQLNAAYDISPRLTVAYQLTRNTLVSGSWGVFNQAPVLYQLNQNKKLTSNQCQHTILSVTKKIRGSLEARVEAYYKKYDKLVMFDKSLNFTNQGYGEAKGVEFILKKEQGNLSGWMSYALSESSRRRNLQDIAYPFYFDQRHSCNLIINYARKNAGKKWIFPYSYSLDFRYASGSPYTPIVLDTLSGNHLLIAGAINSARNPAFNNLNLKVQWLIKTGKRKQHTLLLYLDIWNVLSFNNLVVRQYVINKEQENVTVKNNYAARFYPNFGLRFDFNTNK
ncbi:hypothetical protein CNR22_01960 [Sphingobacteriaceae bacterium]|nr:hypothetical protein CNR22_01960 [Sphingobacteriaceae bacterium]